MVRNTASEVRSRIDGVGGAGDSPASQKPADESGYALLLVFLMAAVVAISLYSEIPRVAFQSQRQKEQLLMERGLQYMRAIQVFKQVNPNQWPRNLDDIEAFNNRHFLRHKYVDPMTGKAEWRLIHIQGNVLTDSLVTKNPADKQSTTGTESTYISAYAGVGQTAVGVQALRPQDRRRASEGGAGGAEGLLPMMPGAATDPSPQPVSEPPAPGTTPGNPPYPAPGVPAQGAPGAQPGMPGSNPPGQAPTDTGGGYLGASPGVGAQMPAQPVPGGIPVPGMTGLPGQTGYPNPQYPNPQYPNPQPSGPNGPGPNAALSLINGILMSPNPRAAQMIQQAQQGGVSRGAMGAGLAGVASNADQEGIMVYNDRTDYKEWEFVFDPSKVTPIASSGGPGGTPGNPQGQMPGGRQAGGIRPPGGQQDPRMGPGMPANGAAGGTPNGPAGMQTAGGPPAGLPPGFRMGRP